MAYIPLGNTQPDYKNWSDVPPAEQNFISSLVDNWLQLIGYTLQVPQWALVEMAAQGLNSAYQIGQYMWHHIYDTGRNPGAYFVPPQAVFNSPGAQYGLNNDQFHNVLTQYQTTMQELTGTGGDMAQFENYLRSQNGQMNASFLRESIMHDSNMLNTYGWLKYGLDYDQFQNQKKQWQTLFGKDLSNTEGIQQLQYLHQAQGTGHDVHAYLTLSQEEKKSAYTGPSANVVR